MILPILSSRRFVGRSAELKLLHDARRALAGGRGTVVLVGGEAGIGKSRLLAEFKRSVSGGRAPLYVFGEALEHAPRPYGPFRQILEGLVAVAPWAIQNAEPLVLRTLGALVPDAVAIRRSGPAPEWDAGLIEKAELFTGVLRFLKTVAAKRATIVALEDLHWSDAATLELLTFLAARISSQRLILIATYRDEEIGGDQPLFAMLARLARAPSVRQIALGRLSESDLRALIDGALDGEFGLTRERERDVVERSEGNPFFAEELLKIAVEDQRQSKAERLPISIRAMILERVTQLSSDDRPVLDGAAVLGHRFTLEALARLLGKDAANVSEPLARLRALGLIVDGESARTYRFRHALTHQTIYDELPVSETKSLHARILTTLESAPSGSIRADDAAYHAWKAGLTDQILRFSERAGDEALAIGAVGQATTYFARALDVATDDDTRIRLFGKSGEAASRQSDFDRAIKAYKAQHEALLALGDLDGAAFALTAAAGEIISSGAESPNAITLLSDFLDANSDRLGTAARNHIHASVARMATAFEDFALARTALGQVQEPGQLRARSHPVYWVARLFADEQACDREAWLEAVRALREQRGDYSRLLRSQALHSIAMSALTFGDNEEAERSVDEAIAIDVEGGFDGALAFANAVKARLLHLCGRLIEARRCVEAALPNHDVLAARAQLSASAPMIAASLGDATFAKRCIDDEVFKRVCDANVPSFRATVSAARATWLLSERRAAEARQLLCEAADLMDGRFAAIHFWILAAQLLDDARLERIERLCAQAAENPQDRVMQAAREMVAAIAAGRHGDVDSARAHAVRAGDRFRALGWPLLEAQALEIAGEAGAALKLYRQCGSVADVRRLESSAPVADRAGLKSVLSRRERQVAELVALGRSNRAVADELGVGTKTVEKYLTAIFLKLNFSSRAEVAAHIARYPATPH